MSTKPHAIAKQLARLKRLLKKGGAGFGYANAIRTSRRVTQLIKEKFNITYSTRQVRHILRNIQVFARVIETRSPGLTKVPLIASRLILDSFRQSIKVNCTYKNFYQKVKTMSDFIKTCSCCLVVIFILATSIAFALSVMFLCDH